MNREFDPFGVSLAKAIENPQQVWYNGNSEECYGKILWLANAAPGVGQNEARMVA